MTYISIFHAVCDLVIETSLNVVKSQCILLSKWQYIKILVFLILRQFLGLFVINKIFGVEANEVKGPRERPTIIIRHLFTISNHVTDYRQYLEKYADLLKGY